MLSVDPFSDVFAAEFEKSSFYDERTATSSASESTTACRKKTIDVPILDSLPHLTQQSSLSSVSTSSTFPSPVHEFFTAPIQWTDEDLTYLLSCLLPDLLLSNTLIYSPLLKDLPSTPSPMQLRLFQKTPASPPPPEAFSKDAPIGTGRPQSRLLIADSGKCSTPEAARANLARVLLHDIDYASYMYTKYNVLTSLYASSTSVLLSLQRGIIEMLGVDDRDWHGRARQLCGEVDESCDLELRIEVYLLSVGREDAEALLVAVDLAREMGERDRWDWSQVYGDATAFLERAGEVFV